MNWPLLSGGAFALLLHGAVLFWLTWSSDEITGLAQEDGLYGLEAGVGMLGSYNETSNRIDAALTPPEPKPEVEVRPELPELKRPEPVPEPERWRDGQKCWLLLIVLRCFPGRFLLFL